MSGRHRAEPTPARPRPGSRLTGAVTIRTADGSTRRVQTFRNPCYEPGHEPCWRCHHRRAFESLSVTDRAAHLAGLRAARTAERLRQATNPTRVPPPRTSTTRW